MGIRPTHDRINTNGVYPMAPSFDTVGWFAKKIEVFQKIGDVLLNNNETSKAIFKNYVIAEDLLEIAETEVQNEFKKFIDLKLPGISKVRLSTLTKSEIADNFRILQGNEVKENVLPWITKNKPTISPEINARIEMASKITNDEVKLAKTFRNKLVKEVENSLPEGVIAIFPTAPFSAPVCGQDDASLGSYRKKLMEMTSIAGMTYRPQISLPCLKNKNRPVGISLLGWKYSDEILLKKITDIIEG
jgi:amidase